jgi:hypothetical protein
MDYFYNFLELKSVYNYLVKILNHKCLLTCYEQEFYNLYKKSIPIINKQHLFYFDVKFNPFTFEIVSFNNAHLVQLKKIVSLTCYQ